MARSYFGSGYHGSYYFASFYYGPRESPELPSNGDGADHAGHLENFPINDDMAVIELCSVIVMSGFLEIVRRK